MKTITFGVYPAVNPELGGADGQAAPWPAADRAGSRSRSTADQLAKAKVKVNWQHRSADPLVAMTGVVTA